MMCSVCCKELKGWCKSFTRTEGLLAVLEATLLVLLISFLVFLILHFVACRTCPEPAPDNFPDTYSEEDTKKPDFLSNTITEPDFLLSTTTVQDFLPSTAPVSESQPPTRVTTPHSSLSPDVNCTWQPSQPTRASTRYFLSERPGPPRRPAPSATPGSLEILGESEEPEHEYDDVDFLEHTDGEPAEDSYKSQVVALVKFKPPGDVTFGCILTKITKFWTLTAASCIESIEEVDSLDSFVIVEQFGEERAERPRAVVDVRLHAREPGGARAHDLAALRADRALRARAPLLRLPRLLDYFLIALGERFHILGYGGYRTVEGGASARRLRQVAVHVVGGAACAAAERVPRWAPRHLPRGAAAERAPRWASRHLSRGAAAKRAPRWAPRYLSRKAAAERAPRWASRHLSRGAAAERAPRWASRHLSRGAAAKRAPRWAPRYLSRKAAAERAPRWASRHLSRGAAARHGACGAAPMCAGARLSRGSPCNYCAGAPLLRAHTLYGIMSDNDACGVACEPQLYVNIATLRGWIDSVIE